jgi:spoIIIJ-associated protein
VTDTTSYDAPVGGDEPLTQADPATRGARAEDPAAAGGGGGGGGGGANGVAAALAGVDAATDLPAAEPVDGPTDAAEADDTDDADDVDEADARPVATGAADLFRESEIAADFVEGLLDILDYDGDIDELVSGGRPVVEVVGGRLSSLVGPRGVTLEALQELARLAVFRQTGAPSRLLLDVGGYRATRRRELAAIAKNAAEKVKEYGEPIKLEPMSAFERKCVHDVINALNGVESESEGIEPSRRIVVRPVP